MNNKNTFKIMLMLVIAAAVGYFLLNQKNLETIDLPINVGSTDSLPSMSNFDLQNLLA
jgi:hypothetical protein